MLNGNVLKFGIEIIDLLMKDERFSFGETDLQIYADGLSSDDDELAKIIGDTNKVYHNSNNDVLDGNYLICNAVLDEDSGVCAKLRFNLNEYYKSFLKSDLETVKENMAREILSKGSNTEMIDFLKTDGYENIKSRLMIRALNFLRNSVRLEDAVYSRFGDMAICAYMKVSEDNGQFFSTKVTKDLLKKYDVSAEQVMQDAVNNSPMLYPERLFFSFSELYDNNSKGLSADETLEQLKKGEIKINSYKPVIAVTNSAHLNGASAIFYPGVAEKIADMFNGDYFAVFVSIHEVYLHPKNTLSPGQLKDNLIATNNEFNNNDVLSYKIYRYDSKRKQFKDVK